MKLKHFWISFLIFYVILYFSLVLYNGDKSTESQLLLYSSPIIVIVITGCFWLDESVWHTEHCQTLDRVIKQKEELKQELNKKFKVTIYDEKGQEVSLKILKIVIGEEVKKDSGVRHFVAGEKGWEEIS